MNKLLSANFKRLFKNTIFWIGCAVMFLLAACMIANNYADLVKYGSASPMDSLFFAYITLIGIVAAAFVSLFTGTEYSDGTIRNKLIIGHKRSTIYLSNLITCTAAVIIMCLFFIVPMCAVGFPLLGLFEVQTSTVLLFALASLLTVTAYTALWLLLAMLIQNKAIVAVLSMFAFLIMFFASIIVSNRLGAKEYYDSYVYTDSETGMSAAEPERNPSYLTEAQRPVYQFIFDLLPTGQAMQISGLDAPNLYLMMLYSVLLAVAASAAGMLAFRRINLR